MSSKSDGYRTLNKITSVVSQSLDLEEILCGALDQVLRATNLETGGIYLLDDETL